MESIYKITSKFSFLVLISLIIGLEVFGNSVANIFYNLPLSPENALGIVSTVSYGFIFAEKIFIALLLVKLWKEGYRQKSSA